MIDAEQLTTNASIDFYNKAFGAKELFRFPMPDGQIGHAEMKIGDRSGTFLNPFGHVWTVGTHKEDVSSEEMQRCASQQGH